MSRWWCWKVVIKCATWERGILNEMEFQSFSKISAPLIEIAEATTLSKIIARSFSSNFLFLFFVFLFFFLREISFQERERDDSPGASRFTCIKTCSFSALAQFICVHPIYSAALDGERTLSRSPRLWKSMPAPLKPIMESFDSVFLLVWVCVWK